MHSSKAIAALPDRRMPFKSVVDRVGLDADFAPTGSEQSHAWSECLSTIRETFVTKGVQPTARTGGVRDACAIVTIPETLALNQINPMVRRTANGRPPNRSSTRANESRDARRRHGDWSPAAFC